MSNPALAAEQDSLLSRVAQDAVHGWMNLTADDRPRRTRVLLRLCIRSGERELLDAVYDYYGMRKP